MGVNDGDSGSSVSFSEIQTFYGGEHPISLSEYYSGGTEVPSSVTTQLLASDSDSGTGDETNANGITVDVQNSDTSSVGALSTSFGQAGTRANFNTANLSFLRLRAEGMGNHTVVFNNTQIFSYSQDDNPGFEYALRGPNYQSGDGGVSSNATSVGSGTLTWSGFRQQTINGVNYSVIGTRTSSTQSRRTFVFTNNTGQTISLTTTVMGGNSNTVTVHPDSDVVRGPINGSSNAWTWSYPAVTSTVNANTNIPESGTINLNTFNSPGNASG